MALRFRSGSSMPRSAARKREPASIRRTRTPLPARERLHHVIPFAATEQAVVDEDPGDPVTDGPMEQGRRHRGVDAARKSEQHPALLAHPFADRGHGLRDDVGRGPDRWTAADPVHEALEDRGALAGMSDLGVELEAVEPARGGARCRRWARSGWRRWCGTRPARRSPDRRGSSRRRAAPPRPVRCGPRSRARGPNGRGRGAPPCRTRARRTTRPRRRSGPPSPASRSRSRAPGPRR